MKLGIAGLPRAGKSTLFAALTGARGDNAPRKFAQGHPNRHHYGFR